jgi:hypothetical protein
MKTSLQKLKVGLNQRSFKMRMGILVLLSRALVMLITLKNKLPLLKKTTALESLLRSLHMIMANLISEMLQSSFTRVENAMKNIAKKSKRPLKTKAKVASKARKPKKVTKAKTNRK